MKQLRRGRTRAITEYHKQKEDIHHSRVISQKEDSTSSSIKMASKSWPFCPECRASLQVDATGSINCRVCPYESNLSSLSSVPSRTTYSADRAVPLWAKSDEEQAALRASKEPSRATVEEPCVRCGAPEVGFTQFSCEVSMRVRLSFMNVQHVSTHGPSITRLAVHHVEPDFE